MILSLKKIKKVGLFLCLFCLILFLLSQLFQLFSTLFPLSSRYEEPLGNAVKVSTNEAVVQTSTTGIGWLDRLLLFYWMGE
jgi:hypothetical protein